MLARAAFSFRGRSSADHAGKFRPSDPHLYKQGGIFVAFCCGALKNKGRSKDVKDCKDKVHTRGMCNKHQKRLYDARRKAQRLQNLGEINRIDQPRVLQRDFANKSTKTRPMEQEAEVVPMEQEEKSVPVEREEHNVLAEQEEKSVLVEEAKRPESKDVGIQHSDETQGHSEEYLRKSLLITTLYNYLFDLSICKGTRTVKVGNSVLSLPDEYSISVAINGQRDNLESAMSNTKVILDDWMVDQMMYDLVKNEANYALITCSAFRPISSRVRSYIDEETTESLKKWMNENDKRVIFAPRCVAGHFYLIVVRERGIRVFDSFAGSTLEKKNDIDKIKSILYPKRGSAVSFFAESFQTDSHSCGVWVYQFAKHYVEMETKGEQVNSEELMARNIVNDREHFLQNIEHIFEVEDNTIVSLALKTHSDYGLTWYFSEWPSSSGTSFDFRISTKVLALWFRQSRHPVSDNYHVLDLYEGVSTSRKENSRKYMTGELLIDESFPLARATRTTSTSHSLLRMRTVIRWCHRAKPVNGQAIAWSYKGEEEQKRALSENKCQRKRCAQRGNAEDCKSWLARRIRVTRRKLGSVQVAVTEGSEMREGKTKRHRNCEETGCDRLYHAKGVCSTHYSQQYRQQHKSWSPFHREQQKKPKKEMKSTRKHIDAEGIRIHDMSREVMANEMLQRSCMERCFEMVEGKETTGGDGEERDEEGKRRIFHNKEEKDKEGKETLVHDEGKREGEERVEKAKREELRTKSVETQHPNELAIERPWFDRLKSILQMLIEIRGVDTVIVGNSVLCKPSKDVETAIDEYASDLKEATNKTGVEMKDWMVDQMMYDLVKNEANYATIPCSAFRSENSSYRCFLASQTIDHLTNWVEDPKRVVFAPQVTKDYEFLLILNNARATVVRRVGNKQPINSKVRNILSELNLEGAITHEKLDKKNSIRAIWMYEYARKYIEKNCNAETQGEKIGVKVVSEEDVLKYLQATITGHEEDVLVSLAVKNSKIDRTCSKAKYSYKMYLSRGEEERQLTTARDKGGAGALFTIPSYRHYDTELIDQKGSMADMRASIASEVFDQGKVVVLVMDYLNGGTLWDYIKKKGVMKKTSLKLWPTSTPTMLMHKSRDGTRTTHLIDFGFATRDGDSSMSLA
ncbi:hypothetical protein PROFUN_12531 [Planoprotostelium fungivorum]|uniref:Ubiquitin-like protease family profile domain-containing protein n=1 Tax=Planoprotostelium fungivorum TaxID=1890364 RepID=A0A2P6MS47_9EUKA|nr:hypothetical protein PROFUN_12531 [Planoprotostelium fungivorum]